MIRDGILRQNGVFTLLRDQCVQLRAVQQLMGLAGHVVVAVIYYVDRPWGLKPHTLVSHADVRLC